MDIHPRVSLDVWNPVYLQYDISHYLCDTYDTGVVFVGICAEIMCVKVCGWAVESKGENFKDDWVA